MIAAVTALSLSSLAAPGLAEEGKLKDQRCYEVRVYHSPPGKLDALHARFRNHTMKLFEKHGMTNVAYWVPIENKDQKLIYILSYPSREAREASWKGFMADPEWQKVWKESEKDGTLVAKIESYLMTAVDYSPEVKPAKGKEEKVFELRTYTAAPGKLPALHERFRKHTLKLFTKHGMEHFGYWEPEAKKGEAPDKLVYVLAHKSAEAAAKSFDAFRADPEWTEVKERSEKDGKLAAKVESVMMQATDYSPTR
jgi:hypothetical protein